MLNIVKKYANDKFNVIFNTFCSKKAFLEMEKKNIFINHFVFPGLWSLPTRSFRIRAPGLSHEKQAKKKFK